MSSSRLFALSFGIIFLFFHHLSPRNVVAGGNDTAEGIVYNSTIAGDVAVDNSNTESLFLSNHPTEALSLNNSAAADMADASNGSLVQERSLNESGGGAGGPEEERAKDEERQVELNALNAVVVDSAGGNGNSSAEGGDNSTSSSSDKGIVAEVVEFFSSSFNTVVNFFTSLFEKVTNLVEGDDDDKEKETTSNGTETTTTMTTKEGEEIHIKTTIIWDHPEGEGEQSERALTIDNVEKEKKNGTAPEGSIGGEVD